MDGDQPFVSTGDHAKCGRPTTCSRSLHSQLLDLSFSKGTLPQTRSQVVKTRDCKPSVSKSQTQQSARLREVSDSATTTAVCSKPVAKSVRKNAQKALSCFECKFHGKSAREMYQHMKDVHPLARPYQCIDCSLWFNTEHNRHVHSNSVHAKEVLPCSLCSFMMYNQFCLTNHEHMHSNKKLQCNYCDVSLSLVGALKEYQAQHFDRQTYPCESCDKSFASALSCYIHVIGKHGPGFVCLKCKWH